MGFKESWNKYFNNHSESRDNHWDPGLKTHYFKTTKDKAFDTLLRYFKNQPGCKINSTSERHGEISINFKGKRRAFIIVTVIMVKPFKTAIDFSITTEGHLFDLGFSHKLITKFYEDLKKEMQIVDVENYI
ncbi:cytosolic protein [Amphibacillus sp. MSJ-3]|uniref:cytosolic protein n=1 Tax=Amphibacillus sp. MSJ-3 TaxID=2841505 RepID=UPI001C0ED088|nr:cytosolic protein [Amphibacillus sp. MSJ-3]MBU5593651.1 cytosolic protein [Amphibacillus sp. MSJ-3]